MAVDMTRLTVREATDADVGGLLAVEQSFRDEGTPDWSIMEADTFEFKLRARSLFVATLDDRCVGYLMWTLLWSFPFMEYVRVLSELRNNGIGTRMLDALVREARARGSWGVWSSTTDARALRWHERNGFRRIGEIEWVWGRTRESMLIKELEQNAS